MTTDEKTAILVKELLENEVSQLTDTLKEFSKAIKEALKNLQDLTEACEKSGIHITDIFGDK